MKTKFLLLPIVLNFLAIALHSQNVEPPVRKGIDPANGAEIAIKRSNDVGQIANILRDTAVRRRDLPRILQRVEEIQPSDGTKEKSKIIQLRDSSLNLQNDSIPATKNSAFKGKWLLKQNETVGINPSKQTTNLSIFDN